MMILETFDILRDRRKSPKGVILAISHIINSIAYDHQIYRFRVFRQSLRETQIWQFCRYAKKTQISLDPKKYRYVGDILICHDDSSGRNSDDKNERCPQQLSTSLSLSKD
jgi:hypothetical protein